MEEELNQGKKQEWRYCVVGNIVKSHYDAGGVLRYGTSAYVGGTKVYLAGRNWDFSRDEITVVGLSRGHQQQVHEVPIELIENLRCWIMGNNSDMAVLV